LNSDALLGAAADADCGKLAWKLAVAHEDLGIFRQSLQLTRYLSRQKNPWLLEVVMKKFAFRAVLIIAMAFSACVAVFADTIHLKDGSVIRGQIISFKNEQFTILVGSGARGRKSQITVYMEDVDWIEFDAAANTGGDTSGPVQTQSPIQQPTNAQRPSNPEPTYTPPSNSTTSGNSTAPPTFFQISVRVRADNASNGWTNSGLVVRRGQRLRITASGRVMLGNNRTSPPDGLPNIPDRDKLMRNQATGALIAVIGDDNDDFIFIGRSKEFVAQRDGVLFLGVNEGNLSDNSGTFDVVIEAEAVSGMPR
jgi:PA-IL-like protein